MIKCEPDLEAEGKTLSTEGKEIREAETTTSEATSLVIYSYFKVIFRATSPSTLDTQTL